MKYDELRKQSDSFGEYRDCAVVATAIACRVKYKDAHAALKSAGRRDRKGTHRHTTWTAITKVLDCQIEKHPRPRQDNGSRYTTLTIGKRFPRGYYLVFVKNHVAAMVNGKVLDWTEGRRHRVQEVWKVTVPRGSRS